MPRRKGKQGGSPKNDACPLIPVEGLLAELDHLKGDRYNWESLWQDVRDFVMPSRSTINREEEKGNRRTRELVDSTAIQANEKFASGLFGFMCRPDEQWFMLVSPYDQVNEDEEAMRYFSTVSRIILKNMYLSHFAMEIHEDFLDLGGYGISCMYVGEGEEYPIRFQSIPISRYYVRENAYGVIDKVFHEFKFTARQAVQMFGIENVGDDVREVYDKPCKENVSKKYTYVHVVYPRRKEEIGRDKTPTSLPYASVYIERKGKKVVKVGGFEEQCYVAGRFMKDADEVYGRSPAINCLPEVKQLNAMRTTHLRSASKVVDPPMMLAHNSVMNKPRFNPGDIIYVRASMFGDRPVPLQTGGRIDISMEMLQAEEMKIKEAFYADMFDMLLDGNKYMTATEVETRRQNKLFLLAPMLARVQTEKLSPIIQRCFTILNNKGLLPEIPDILKKFPQYNVHYVGKMAMAMKSLDIMATQATLGMLQEPAQVDPSVMKNFDWNTMARDLAMKNGMPTKYIRPKEEVEAEKQQEAEAQAQAQQMQQMQQGAQAAESLGKPVDPSSVLAKVAG